MIIAVPDDYHGLVRTLDCRELLAKHELRIFRDVAPPHETLVANLRDAEVIVPIRERTTFTADLIRALPRLKMISQTGRSTHHIDIPACTAHGVMVTAGASASPRTVAEHTWALILSSRRRVVDDAAAMKRGAWRESFSLSLHGRTLGLFGLGTIGSLVAAVAPAFGMRVLVWGRAASAQRAAQAGYEVAHSQRDLFERSDVLSLHVRLATATRGIVSAADLACMKPTALFVNTARAELVAPGALENALRLGRPGHGAVDVYENEPVQNGRHPLLEMTNALCTAHSAWLEHDTYELYFGEAFANVVAYAAGRMPRLVNPEALARQHPASPAGR